MKTIRLMIDETKLPAHTENELKEWILYKTGANGSMSDDNPLADSDLESIQVHIATY